MQSSAAVPVRRLIHGATGHVELGPAAFAGRCEIGSMSVGECRHEVQPPPGLGIHVHGARFRERLRGVVDFNDQRSTLSVNLDRDRARRGMQHGVGDQFTGDQLDSVQLVLAEPYVPERTAATTRCRACWAAAAVWATGNASW